MRVKISYGMDVKDVPTKVAELVQESANKLNKLADSLARMANGIKESDSDIPHTLGALEKDRNRLNEIDMTISDAQAILAGLNNYYNGEQNVSDRRSTMDTSGNVAEEAQNTRQR